METNESFVTAPSVDEVSSESANNTMVREDEELPSHRHEGSAEIPPVSLVSDKEDVSSNRHENESDDVLLQSRTERVSEGLQVDPSGVTDTTPPAPGTLNVESSSTDESYSAYIARKREQLGDVPEADIHSQRTIGAEKSSLSAVLELAPGQGEPDNEEDDSDPVPEVTFLDTCKYHAKGIIKSSNGPQNQDQSPYEGCVGSNDELETSEP